MPLKKKAKPDCFKISFHFLMCSNVYFLRIEDKSFFDKEVAVTMYACIYVSMYHKYSS